MSHTFTHTLICLCVFKRTHMYLHVHLYTYKCIHLYVAYINRGQHMFDEPHWDVARLQGLWMHLFGLTCKHMGNDSKKQKLTHTHTHNTHTHVNLHRNCHNRTHTHMHTHTRTQIQTHTQTHTHTHTRAHKNAPRVWSCRTAAFAGSTWAPFQPAPGGVCNPVDWRTWRWGDPPQRTPPTFGQKWSGGIHSFGFGPFTQSPFGAIWQMVWRWGSPPQQTTPEMNASI